MTEAPDGTRVLVQTDHRSVDEIDQAPELSALFALARILGPQRSSHGVGSVVRYVALGGLHPTIARVAASTGAQVELDRRVVDLGEIERTAPAALADEAFAGLAHRVLAREGLAATEDGLAAVENASRGAPRVEDNAAGYWTAVTELAAVTGEVLRARTGGAWVIDEHGYAPIPFMFRAGDAQLNAIGKAARFLEHGDSQRPSHLLRALDDGPGGPLLLTLKPSRWSAAAEMVCEPLVDLGPTGADIPLVVFGTDRPNTFAMFKRGGDGRDLVKLRAEALANLVAIDVEVEQVTLDAVTFWVVHGSYFAAEKILDRAFMRRMHQTVGELLAVSVPEKGRLMITNAAMTPQAIAAFIAVTRGVFERDEGGRQVSPTVFLVSGGVIVGVAQPSDSASEPAKKPGILKRWFS